MATPNIRLVVMCTTFGRSLAQELGSGKAIAKGLLEINNTPLVSYWANAAQAVPRLLPLESKMFVMCNDDNHAQYARWARASGGLIPEQNIVSNGCKAGSPGGLASDIAAFVAQTGGAASDLVVVEGDYLFHPTFNLQRVVEHAMIRGKDTLTWLQLRDDETQSAHKILTLNSHSVNPKVESVSAYPERGAVRSLAASAPLYVFKKGTVEKMQGFLQECPPCSPVDQIGALLQWLPTVSPVYALNVGHVFDVKTAESLRYVDNLFAFFTRTVTKTIDDSPAVNNKDRKSAIDFQNSEPGGQITQRLVQDARLATGMADAAAQALDPAALGLDETIMVFQDRYENFSAIRSSGRLDVPERFGNADLWKNKAKEQHPVYTTTNHIYGYKKPCTEELPTKFYGIRGMFTGTYPIVNNKASMWQNNGFVVTATTSKVHRTLNDF